MPAMTHLVLALPLLLPQSTTLPSAPPASSEAASRAHKASENAKGRKPPVLVYSVDPEFSELSRKRHFSGNVRVAFVVDQNGRTQNVHIVRGVGPGLDEKAVEAVKQYRFKPATVDGAAVAMPLSVEVNFQIF